MEDVYLKSIDIITRLNLDNITLKQLDSKLYKWKSEGKVDSKKEGKFNIYRLSDVELVLKNQIQPKKTKTAESKQKKPEPAKVTQAPVLNNTPIQPPEWNKKLSEYLWLPFDKMCENVNLSGPKDKPISKSWFQVNKVSVFPQFKPLLYKIKTDQPIIPPPEGLRTTSYRLRLDEAKKSILIRWFEATRWVYNECIRISEVRPVPLLTKTYLRQKLINEDANIEPEIKDLFMREPKIPADVLASPILDFINARATQMKMVKEKKIRRFKMKPRKTTGFQSFGIPHKFIKISRNGIVVFPTRLGELIIREKIPKIKHEIRVTWNTKDVFMIHVPIDFKPRPFPIREKVCSIDPGESVFATVYGSDGDAYLIGGNGSKRVDKLASIASRMRAGIKRTFVDGKKRFEKSNSKQTRVHLREKAKVLENRAKNLITDIHRKTVKFLTSKYDKIIIPEFGTQNMARKCNAKGKWKRRINKGTTRRLIRWSHYKFRKLLENSGGTKITVGTEEYTSVTCGYCFNLNSQLKDAVKLWGSSRVFVCPTCGIRMHRDLNAARNIMMLNWERASLQSGCPVPTECNSSVRG